MSETDVQLRLLRLECALAALARNYLMLYRDGIYVRKLPSDKLVEGHDGTPKGVADAVIKWATDNGHI